MLFVVVLVPCKLSYRQVWKNSDKMINFMRALEQAMKDASLDLTAAMNTAKELNVSLSFCLLLFVPIVNSICFLIAYIHVERWVVFAFYLHIYMLNDGYSLFRFLSLSLLLLSLSLSFSFSSPLSHSLSPSLSFRLTCFFAICKYIPIFIHRC